MVDIARDPRWGRIMEGAGEDPYLGSPHGRGAGSRLPGPGPIGAPDHLLACVKHFAGDGAADGGRDYDSSNISDELLWNVYLPPFEAAVRAGAGSLMSAYMDLNGVPATGNRWLLNDVLREKWGFQGFVVSDWESIRSLTTHGFASGPEDAAARAVNAGVDMEMTSHLYEQALPAALKDGSVKQSTIDTAVRRILIAKYRLGLFNQSLRDHARKNPRRKFVSPPHSAEAAKGSPANAPPSALLHNEGRLLPLKSATSIAPHRPACQHQTRHHGLLEPRRPPR